MIAELQDVLLKMEQAEVPTTHRFSDGMYARQIEIPAGVCLVGALHKTQHFFVVSQGECMVIDGENREHLKAPHTGITEPGTKRAIYALTPTVFTTFHPTHETDIKKIESDIIEPEGLRIANNPQELLT